jgi:putative toxin-antitoxin system antitoxin component (TIGR02293 family)
MNFDTKNEQKVILEWLKLKPVSYGENSSLNYIAMVEEGLPTYSVNAFARLSRLSKGLVAELIHVSDRTLQRNAPEKRLSKGTSERLLELARLFYKGTQVFGATGKFVHWLGQPNPALGNKKPINLLDTSLGTAMVMDLLGRIEYGVYS